MVRVLASSAVDRGFKPRSGQTNDYKIGICCFSAKHVALRRKSKDWLARFQWDDVEVPFVLEQHAELDYYSASSLKQQSVGRHIILIMSQPVFALSP
jgi:hypothetical protein